MSYRVKIVPDGYGNTLKIFIDNKEFIEYCDHTEPEDNSFLRDYDWIEYELLRAYKKGYEDGKFHETLKRAK